LPNPDPADTATPPPAIGALSTAARGRTPNILVVDDELEMRKFLAEALAQDGYHVETAANGEEAIRLVRENRINVALCDLKMPGIDGLQTLERIKEIDPDIEFIIITGHGTMESAIESLRRGAFDFLPKPVLLKDLLFSVGKALERRDLRERLGLFELSRTIFSTLEPDELYRHVVQSAIQVLRADDASLMLLDQNGELFIALSTSLQQEILEGTHLALGERIAGRVAQQPEPVVINENIVGDARFVDVQPLRRYKAAIVCPLTMRGELLGVLNISRVQISEHYSEHDRQNAMILASLVSLALGNARLNRELQARLMQLQGAQEEVIQTEKMTALGNLLSGVAHELNNPLCGVLGYAQLLQQNNPDSRMRKGVDVILREAERASRIVNNLLTFARRERPEKRALQLNNVLMRTLERKTGDLKIARVEVKAELDPHLPPVLGDAQQLQTVFLNLITNAQQAMFEAHGRGVLTVRSEGHEERVLVIFTDDGPGIPGENLRRVFDPFFTTREVGKGVGLGLSVCFAIIREHGGAIRVGAGTQGGAAFTIELPAAPAAARGEDSATAAESTSVSAADGAPRVLVAEAESQVQDVLVEILQEIGCRVETTGDAARALERIRGESFDAIIADDGLPRLDGRALLATLRAERPALARRLILLSGDNAMPRLLELAATSGVVVMGKPFDLEAMRKAIRHILGPIGSASQTIH
jgi:signal transduction histidine kinase